METIKNLRCIIDQIDEQILDLIKSRMEVVVEIGEVKKKNHLKIKDKIREDEIYKKLEERAKEKGIKPQVVKKLWKSMIEISYDLEEGGKNGNS